LPNMYLSVCFWIFSVSSLRHAPLVHIFFFLCGCRSQCSRRTMTIFPKMYTLEIIRKQPVVIQTIFWHMGMGNLLLVFKIIFVLMAHTDGITIWKHPSTVILSDNFMCMSYSSLVLFCCFLYVLLVNAYKKWT
jgi:hypothetical protein